MVERIMRIIRLDKSVFKEIANDPNATTQAAMIVAVVSILGGIGSGIALFTVYKAATAVIGGLNIAVPGSVVYGPGHFFLAFIAGVLSGVIGWVLRSYLTKLVGGALFQGKSTLDQMLRVLGYATAPGLLGFFVFIPCIGWIAAAVGGVLALIAALLAIQQIMDFDIGKAIVTVIIAAIGVGILNLIINAIFGIPRGMAF